MTPTPKTHGFTLLELLIGMAILSLLLLAFTQIFGGSLRASGQINSQNELIYEGQIAQQLIASRLQQAVYLYPPGATLQLNASGPTSRNTVRSGAGWNWQVGTDPFIAMLLPPETTGTCAGGSESACFRFFAYYATHRGTFVASTVADKPNPEENNEDAWLLMEYRANLLPSATCNPAALMSLPVTDAEATGVVPCFTGRKAGGKMLADYVQPATAAPTYTLFSLCVPALYLSQCPAGTQATDRNWVELDLRLLQNHAAKAIRAPAGRDPLSTRVYPRNWTSSTF